MRAFVWFMILAMALIISTAIAYVITAAVMYLTLIIAMPDVIAIFMCLFILCIAFSLWRDNK